MAQSARSAVSARTRARRLRWRGVRTLALLAVGVVALAVAHLVGTLLLIQAIPDRATLLLTLVAMDAALASVLVIAIAWHLHSLNRERTRQVIVEAVGEALSVPASIEASGDLALAILLGTGVAHGGLLAVVSAEGDTDEPKLVPLAIAGARRGWGAEPAPLAGRMIERAAVRRERVTGDRWLLGFELNVGRSPWVARVPIRSGDEDLGLLVLAARHRGWLADTALLRNVGTALGAALDHGRQFQVAFERSRELEEQNARRREFLYAIAHELRSPLTSIQAFAELLTSDRELVNGNQELLLASLSRGVDRLATFVNDLLNLGRVEDAAMRVTTTTIDVTEALRGAETILRPSFMAREQALTLDLPEAGIAAVGDARALEQVMLNLLSNANRFTPTRGAVTVHAHRENGHVRIEVCDSGPGIDPADRVRVFEPFYRVQRAGAPEVPGSGLGLAVARRLTELQGGRIWIDGAEGGGTRFCIELAAATVREEAPAPDATLSPAP